MVNSRYLTDAYTTIVDGRWFIRRDFDSKCYRIGKADYKREDETGIPAYVGYQMEIKQPKTVDDVIEQIQSLVGNDWLTDVFVDKFTNLAARYAKK